MMTPLTPSLVTTTIALYYKRRDDGILILGDDLPIIIQRERYTTSCKKHPCKRPLVVSTRCAHVVIGTATSSTTLQVKILIMISHIDILDSLNPSQDQSLEYYFCSLLHQTSISIGDTYVCHYITFTVAVMIA
jgi:hypothetical protein